MAGIEVVRIDLAELKEQDYIGLRNIVAEGVSTTHISLAKTLGEFAFGFVMAELEHTKTGMRFGGTDQRIARLPRSGYLEPVDSFVTLDIVSIGSYRSAGHDFARISDTAWSRTPLACETLTLLKS